MNSYKKLIWLHNFVCMIVIIGTVGYSIYTITQMPDTIPIHWSNGKADGWGSKWITLLLPSFTMAIYVFSIFHIKYLRKKRKPMVISIWTHLGCVILFAIINWSFIHSALS